MQHGILWCNRPFRLDVVWDVFFGAHVERIRVKLEGWWKSNVGNENEHDADNTDVAKQCKQLIESQKNICQDGVIVGGSLGAHVDTILGLLAYTLFKHNAGKTQSLSYVCTWKGPTRRPICARMAGEFGRRTRNAARTAIFVLVIVGCCAGFSIAFQKGALGCMTSYV